jgi:hypothetical protein
MKQTRFTEAQIVSILQEADAYGAAVRELCNRHGVREQTFPMLWRHAGPRGEVPARSGSGERLPQPAPGQVRCRALPLR